MADKYKQFDKDPIVDTSDVVLKGFRFRKRELALGVVVLAFLLIIIILAALLAATKNNNDDKNVGTGAFSATKDDCFTPACLKTAAYVTELVNKSAAKPCDDFHTFACSNFPQVHPLGTGQDEVTTFQLIHNENQERLRRLLTEPTSNNNPYHYETKMRNFFATCQDHFSKMQQQGRPFLRQVVSRAGGWWALQGDDRWSPADYNFQQHLQKVHVDFWTDAFFSFSVITDWLNWNKAAIQISLGGIGMSYQYYYNTDLAQPLQDYKKFMRKVGSLLLRDADLNITDQERSYRLNTFVQDAFYVENELAMIEQFAETTQNPHASDKRLKLSDLNSASSGALDWVSLFTYMFDKAPVTADTYVVVLAQDYVNKLTTWLTDMPAANKSRILNNYLTWRMAHKYAQDLSWDYIHANRQVYVDITGQANFLGTWRYCVGKVDRDMVEALGALFVKKHFSQTNRRTAHEITDYVKKALIDSLQHSTWFSDSTKQMAITKIQESLIKLGYPDYMMNDATLNQVYANLHIDEVDYFGNLLAFNAFFKEDWNKRLNNPNDRTVWYYATYDFVAQYYNPWKQLIVPAGLLQFPIYDHSSPRYMNYGSMGSIVARQLTHAIDEIGNYFMLNGSHYGTWWSANTTAKYEEVRKCVITAFQNITMGPFSIPGDFQRRRVAIDVNFYAPIALGESSGVKLAYMAYQKWISVTGGEKRMPGNTFTNNQLFFLSYAQTYCKNRNNYWSFVRVVNGRTLTEKVKVNSALAHVKEFQEAFQCPSDSRMVAPVRCGLY